jgi:hypothetical protein
LQAEKDSGEAMVQRLNQASERYRRVIQATGMKVE